jgi:dihydrofolate synthase/folylpolyglutamate synthase
VTYEEALAYWFRHVNYELRPPEAADLKLDRMRALLACLGNPHQRLRILHIAGSKGKGSTSALLATILQRAGYRTGLFTSPHLSRLEERFQINGQLIEPNEVAELLSVIRISVEQSLAFEDRPPTFFELTTALGLLHFLKHRCEAVVLEVGLGGRLDSTNVCQPVVAVITSISYDHTRILGDRLEQIAWEKAGIIKPGRPVVSGVTSRRGSSCHRAGERATTSPATSTRPRFYLSV